PSSQDRLAVTTAFRRPVLATVIISVPRATKSTALVPVGGSPALASSTPSTSSSSSSRRSCNVASATASAPALGPRPTSTASLATAFSARLVTRIFSAAGVLGTPRVDERPSAAGLPCVPRVLGAPEPIHPEVSRRARRPAGGGPYTTFCSLDDPGIGPGFAVIAHLDR